LFIVNLSRLHVKEEEDLVVTLFYA